MGISRVPSLAIVEKEINDDKIQGKHKLDPCPFISSWGRKKVRSRLEVARKARIWTCNQKQHRLCGGKARPGGTKKLKYEETKKGNSKYQV